MVMKKVCMSLALLLCGLVAISGQDDQLTRLGWKTVTESAVPKKNIKDHHGNKIRFSELDFGEVAIINFWATWCEPCVAELPDLAYIHNTFEKEGIRVILVNVQEKPQATRDFLDEIGVTIPSYYDTKGKISSHFGVRGIPVSFLVNGQGKVFARYIGIFPWTNSAIIDVLQRYR